MIHTPNSSRYSRSLRPAGSLRSAAKLGLGLLSLLSLSAGTVAHASTLHAGTVTWDGASADWFAAPSHWIGGIAPSSGDDAVNNSTAAMTLGQSTTIQSFFSNGAFTLQGGNFSGSLANAAGTLTVNNVFTDNGGGIANFTLNQGTGGSVVFTTANGNNFSNSIINANLDLSTNNNAYVQILNADTLNGTTTLGTSYGLALYNNASSLINNGTIAGFGGIYQQNGGTTFINNGTGTVNANSSGNVLGITEDNFANAGTTGATNGGILTIAGNTTTTNTGVLAANTGGILNLSGTFTNSAASSFNSVGGTINVNSASLLGTVNGVGATSLVYNTSNGNNFNGTTVNANLDLATHGDAYVQILNADTLNGTTTLGTSYGLALYNNASSLINNGTIAGYGGIYQQNGGTTFINSSTGTVNANVTGKTLGITEDNFANAGTTGATNGGILTIAGNTTTTNTGVLAANTGGILNLSGTFTNSAASSFNSVGGTINVNSASLLGTVNGVGATSLVYNTSNGNNFNGTTVNANLDLATHGDAYVQILNADTLNGTTTLGTSYGLALYNNASSLINNGTIAGYGGIYQQNGGTTFINSSTGTVNANVTGKTLGITEDNFANAGTTGATNGGILTIAGNTTTTNTGVLAATGGGTLNLSGTLNSNAGNSINGVGGTINVNSASLLGTVNGVGATSLVYNTSNGNNFNGTTVNANLDLATHGDAYVQILNADTLNGTTTLGTSYGLALYNNASVLTNSGTIAGYGGIYQQNGGTTFINNGTVNASAAGQTLGINTDNFINAGTIAVQNGATLTTAGNVNMTDSGNILVNSGGTATFGQPVTQTAGLTQVDGTLNSPLTLTGGTLKGTGTINGAVTNTGGTVAAGDSPGTLTVNGPFSQASGGTLNAQFDNTGGSILKVLGAVTTGGVLDVNYLGTMPYTATGPFTFLDYGTLATSITSASGTQYFANETFDPAGNGLITGHNGFTYELLNNTGLDALQLQVLTNGAPTPAVPEASTTISLGLLLALGGGGLLVAKRKKAA